MRKYRDSIATKTQKRENKARDKAIGPSLHSQKGILVDGQQVFEWFKCPIHDAWMQPELKPFPHWTCRVKYCDRKRPAKFRTNIERKIFRLHKFTEENG